MSPNATPAEVISIIKQNLGGCPDILYNLTAEGDKVYIWPRYDPMVANERPGIGEKLPIYDSENGMFYVYSLYYDDYPDTEYGTAYKTVEAILSRPKLYPFNKAAEDSHYWLVNTIRPVLFYFRILSDIIVYQVRAKNHIGDFESHVSESRQCEK